MQMHCNCVLHVPHILVPQQKKSTHYIIQHGSLIQKKCTPHVQKRAGGWQVLVGEGSLNKHQSNEVCIARVLKKVIVPRVQ